MALEFLMGGEWGDDFVFLLFDGFVVLALMLVERPTLLATFFCAGWLPLGAPTDERVQGRTSSAIFLVTNFIARSAACGVHPKLKL